MHSRDHSYRNGRKIHSRGKWESILVLLIVIAGLIVTTIAAIKAKEKRDLIAAAEEEVERFSNRIDLVSKPIITTSATTDVTMDSGQVVVTADHSSVSSSVPVVLATSGLRHDGLPGYPPPPPPLGFDSNFTRNNPLNPRQSNVELASLGSGFVLLNPGVRRKQPQPDQQANPSANVRLLRLVPNRIKPIDTIKSRHDHSSNSNEEYLTQDEMIWLQRARPEVFSKQTAMIIGNGGGGAPIRKRVKRDTAKKRGKRRKKYTRNDSRRQPQQQQQRRRQRRQQEMKEMSAKGVKVAKASSSTRKRSTRKGYQPVLQPSLVNRNRYVDSEDDEDDGDRMQKKKKRILLRKRKKFNQTIGSKNRYSKEESKQVEKYDILGSGNFEIIRGGIIDNEKKNVAAVNGEEEAEEEVVENGNKDGQVRREEEEDTDGFEPFNFDLFANDPILGFQGYDNFDSSKNQLTTTTTTINPKHNTAGRRNSFRNYFL